MLAVQIILKDVYLNIIIAQGQHTSKHRPWILKKQIEISNNRGFTIKIERALKKSKSRILIEKIILEINNVEQLAQPVRVPMHRD